MIKCKYHFTVIFSIAAIFLHLFEFLSPALKAPGKLDHITEISFGEPGASYGSIFNTDLFPLEVFCSYSQNVIHVL